MDIMDVYLLLDRTGSMGPIWTEAVASINAYVEELSKDGLEYRITLAVFDDYEGFQFDLVRDAVPIKKWKTFKDNEVTPRGCTPLFDALVRMVSLAEARDDGKAVMVVMTDGHENASHEVSREGAQAALDRIKKRGWQVVFLVVNFDAFDDAASVGIAHSQRMNSAKGHFDKAMLATAERTRAFHCQDMAMEFDEVIRMQAGEDKVPKQKGNKRER